LVHDDNRKELSELAAVNIILSKPTYPRVAEIDVSTADGRKLTIDFGIGGNVIEGSHCE
jgi:hypothetical protein